MYKRYKEIYDKILQCKGCPLRKYSRNIIPGKGNLLGEILIINTAPNLVDDTLNAIFSDRTGHFLNIMLIDAKNQTNYKSETPFLSNYYLLNMVMCRSWVYESICKEYGQDVEPEKEHILSCMQNAIKIINLMRPKLVIFLGKLVESYYKKDFPEGIRILHPKLHLNYGGKISPVYMADIRTISEGIEKFL